MTGGISNIGSNIEIARKIIETLLLSKQAQKLVQVDALEILCNSL